MLKSSLCLGGFIFLLAGCSGKELPNKSIPDAHPVPETGTDTGSTAKVLIEGFQSESSSPALEIAMSDRIFDKLARKYKQAFEDKSIDQIKSHLREKLSCQVNRKNPDIAELQVKTGNPAMDVAILKGWLLALEDEALVDRNKAMAKVDKLKAEFSSIDKELNREIEKLQRMKTEIDVKTSELGRPLTSDDLPDAYKALESTIKMLQVKHAEMAEKLAEAKLIPKMDEFKRRVILLTRINPVQVTEKEQEFYLLQKKRCPELPEVNFSGTSNSGFSHGKDKEPVQIVD